MINIDINEYLPDDLVIAPINRRGFENIDPCLDFDITEAASEFASGLHNDDYY